MQISLTYLKQDLSNKIQDCIYSIKYNAKTLGNVDEVVYSWQVVDNQWTNEKNVMKMKYYYCKSIRNCLRKYSDFITES